MLKGTFFYNNDIETCKKQKSKNKKKVELKFGI